MIDKLSVYTEVNLNINKLDFRIWKPVYDKGSAYPKCFICNKGLVRFMYVPHRCRLIVFGRLINLSGINSKVANLDSAYKGLSFTKSETKIKYLDDGDMGYLSWYDVDDKLLFPDREQEVARVYDVEMDLDDIFTYIDAFLYKITKRKLSILDFKVTRMEFCYNISTTQDCVERYLQLFNLIFMRSNTKNHKNIAIEKDKPLHTSFYVKTTSDYVSKKKKNYTVNFYNKLDQLLYMKNDPNRKYRASVTQDDLDEATGKLRLEVQAYSNYLSSIYNKYIKKTGKMTLESFIDPELSKKVILDKYSYFIGNPKCDFYSYKGACKKIDDSSLADTTKKALKEYILKVSQNHKLCDKTHMMNRKKLEDINIHWFPIPAKWGIDFLISPATLLEEEVKSIEQQRRDYLNDICNGWEDEDFGDIEILWDEDDEEDEAV